MASTQKGNEGNCDVVKLWQVILLCLREMMMNTKAAVRSDF